MLSKDDVLAVPVWPLRSCVLLCLLVPSSAGRGPLCSFFGVIGDGPLLTGQEDVAAQTAVMHAVGVGSMRLAVYWDSVEPYATPDAVPASDQGRIVVRDGVPTDLRAYDDVDRSPRHVAHHDPARGPAGATWRPRTRSPHRAPRRADRGLRRLLAHPRGSATAPTGSLWAEHPDVKPVPIRAWQIWNEPDIDEVLRRRNRRAGLRPPAAAAHRTLKAADPHSQTVPPG